LRRFNVKKSIAVALVALASLLAQPVSALASTSVLRVTPPRVNFGTKPVGSVSFKSAEVKNTSSETIDLLVTVTFESDDFGFGLLPGSTCPVLEPEPLAPGESCVVVVRFSPSETFVGLKQQQILLATAADPLTGEVVDSVQIVFIGRAR
jgi:hypothetical protein